MHIPVIDLVQVCSSKTHQVPEEDRWFNTAHSLKDALQKIGFVYIKNHGIPEERISKAFSESVKFFSLPLETKERFARDFETTFHGYTKIGGERMTLDTSLELRETFDIALADQAEFRECPYPDEDAPDFKPAMRELIQESQSLVQVLLKLLALALGLKDDKFFIPLHKNVEDSSVPNYTQLRSLLYPKVPEELGCQPGVVRCAEHTDYGTITLLFQDSMGGLQIKSINGDWVPATPIPGCILMNVGDLLQIWSNGLFPSSVHRVVVPEDEVKRNVPRQSIALFVKPDNSTLVHPLLDSGNSAIANNKSSDGSVYAGDHFRKRTIYHHQMAKNSPAR